MTLALTSRVRVHRGENCCSDLCTFGCASGCSCLRISAMQNSRWHTKLTATHTHAMQTRAQNSIYYAHLAADPVSALKVENAESKHCLCALLCIMRVARSLLSCT